MTTADRLLMESYVVRIYRRARGRARRVVGVVEQVGVPGRRSFGDVDGLWEILSAPPRPTRARRPRRVTPPPLRKR